MKKLISRRQFLVAMGAIAAAGALSACGGGSSSTTTTASSSAAASSTAENVSLKLATWDNTSNTTVSDAVAAFEKANPDIKVEIIDIPSSDYTTKLSVMLNGGSDVDAFYIKDSDTAKSLVDKGQLADLTGYIADAGIDLSVYNGLAENFAFDGKQYALPARTDFYVMYYNKDLFDAAGVAYPSNDWTWSEFEETAKKLTSGTGAAKALTVKHISLDRPITDKVGEINQMLGEEHSLIMLGELSVADGLAEMASRAAEIMG